MSRKPVWAEGVLVSQHHFQTQDSYHELLLRDRIAAVRRFDWGILGLEIDERALQAGQFRLQRLEAIWPDGLFVRCGGRSDVAPPEARSFEGHFPSDAPHLDVLIGLANEGGSANVAAPGESAGHRRFARVAQSVPDFNTGGGHQEVDVAVPNLRILFGSERQENISILRVAQLVREASGKVIVRDNFVPSVLHTSAAPFLTSGIHRVLAALTARQRELATTRKQRNTGNIEFHFTDARRFWLLHTLNGVIPHLTHLLDTKQAHPEELYIVLTRLIGQLSTFAADSDPTALPRFNYDELGELFEQIFAKVLSLLFIDSAPTYVEVPLERRLDDGVFLGRIPEARLVNHEMFIAVKSELAESIVREQVPQLLKVAAWSQIAEVVKQARHGVRAEVEWHPSTALPLKPGVCFFRLRREGSFWEEIAKTRTLALYLPRGPEWKDTLLSAYAISPEYLH